MIASDLEEEVPIWRLRLKQAQDRGAYLVAANSRHTRLEDFAVQGMRNDRVVEGDAIRYRAGDAVAAMTSMNKAHPAIARRLRDAKNLVIVVGAEGLTLKGSQALAQAAANFLIETQHVGKANSGLLSTLPGANGMGQHYLGFTPQTTMDIIANPPKTLIVAQAELLDDDPTAAAWLNEIDTVIYANFFRDDTAELADYALPIQTFAERDGSFVNGERRVQRFYTAQGPMGDALPAWKLFGSVRQQMGMGRLKASAAAVMLEISKSIEDFAGMRYKALSKVERQFPDVGGRDLYYGGTAYNNQGGLGIQIPSHADRGGPLNQVKVTAPKPIQAGENEIVVIPITRLYNRQRNFRPTALMEGRVLDAHAVIHTADANARGIRQGDRVELRVGEARAQAQAVLSDEIDQGSVALPRHLTDETAPMVIAAGTLNRVAAAVASGD